MRERIQNYVFTPGVGNSGTIELQGYVELQDILVITNVTTNTIIYQFSDPNKGATVTYNSGTSANFPQSQNGVTTITLKYNTSTMLTTHDLQIYVETREVTIRPWHFGTDAIERMRMSQPESLIDADFEYGLQNTKWQSLALNNLMPAIYENPGADLPITSTGYATLVAATNTINNSTDTTFTVANQSGVAAPSWVDNDYALLVNQTNIVPITANITANIISAPQRTISFSGNASPFVAGDNLLILKVEPEASACTVAADITSTATTSILITGANTFVDGDFVQIGTATTGVFELAAIQSGGGTGTLSVVRRTNGTNAGGANLPGGAEVKKLANIEIAQVYSITSDTSMVLTRGWYNTTPLDFITTGSQIQKLNASDGTNGNLEIVQVTTSGTSVNQTLTVTRSAAGSVAKNSAGGAGCALVRLVGIYQAGTPVANGTNGYANVSQIGVNSTTHSVVVGGYFSTQNHRDPNSEGLYFAGTSETNNFFYYPKKSAGLPLGYPLNQYDTVLRKATAYTGAPIPVSNIASDNNTTRSTITVTTPYAHGLFPGTPLLVNMSGGTANLSYASGAFPVKSVPSLTSFTYLAKYGARVDNSSLTGNIILKPNSYFIHRPFDGGIAMTCGSPHHGASAARQTKKYFRYQSGKGLFFTSGTLFCPTFDITGCSATGTTSNDDITVITEQNHQLQVGAIVRFSGIITTGYAGITRRVTQVVSDRSFVVEAGTTLGATTPVFAPQPRINVTGWYGGVVRAGMFDDQNGVFWEYDGESLNVVKRSSTYQLAGLASVQSGSNLVTGDGTCKFLDQITIGSAIVIRGMTHTVTSIADQNTLTVVPEYRGVNNETRVKLVLVQDQRIPRPQFNIDIMDGTGPSGYVIDVAKMQMIMIQYTWYGAGFIEFGVRGPNGKMILAHRIKNNNVNDEAYMRSGNLPARYEAASTGALTKLFAAADASQTYMLVNDGTFLPGNVSTEYPAYISVDNEIIRYSNIAKGTTSNTVANISGLDRASSTFTQWIEGESQTFTQGTASSHSVGSGVFVLGCTTAPTLTHWGSAVIMDGGYQQDKGFSFTFNRQNVALPGTLGSKITLFLMRLAPAVSNTIIGQLGTRDLVNRAALDLNNLVVNLTGGRYLVEGILNPTNLNTTATQFLNLNTTAYGNQPSFTQFSTNIQFSGTTIGGIQPGAMAFAGQAPFRGPAAITSATYQGTSANRVSATSYTSRATVDIAGAGTGLTLDLTLASGTGLYSSKITSISVRSGGSGYTITSNVKVLGTQLGGTSPANDLYVDINTVGSDALVVNNILPTTVTGSGSGANISLSSSSHTSNLANYSQRSITYSVNATGDNYSPGDTLSILGYNFGANAANVTNDMTLTVQSVSGSVTGGERLFAIPISGTNAGTLDLTQVKQLGTSAVPGNGVYPDGPEVLAITLTCIAPQTVQQYADVQLSFSESQA